MLWDGSAAAAPEPPFTCDEKSKYRKRFCPSTQGGGKAKRRRSAGGEQSWQSTKEVQAGQSILNIMCCLRLVNWMSTDKSADQTWIVTWAHLFLACLIKCRAWFVVLTACERHLFHVLTKWTLQLNGYSFFAGNKRATGNIEDAMWLSSELRMLTAAGRLAASLTSSSLSDFISRSFPFT